MPGGNSNGSSYRPGVGLALFDRRGLVFAAQRIDTPGEAWQMPQGGIDKGEEPHEAALRELKEEAGTNKAKVIAEMNDWVTYDLPPHLVGVAFHGKYGGQRQKWFAMRFTGQDSDIDLYAHEPEFSDWKWLAIEELSHVIVPFKRDSYAKVVSAFRHLAKPE